MRIALAAAVVVASLAGLQGAPAQGQQAAQQGEEEEECEVTPWYGEEPLRSLLDSLSPWCSSRKGRISRLKAQESDFVRASMSSCST